MPHIKLLDEKSINKIAAGEVIERPLSVVKELVENAIDAGADAITVEIKGGGIDMIRVSDNGDGIPADEIRMAFTPHATSKIQSADDLFDVRSLGFRGEALSTIASVCRIEMVTKTRDSLTGILYKMDGGKEISMEEVGAGDGTTFITRDLFINVPARRKFLKSAMTEASYITEFVQKIAIERSDIAFKYVVNNDNKLVTTGNGSEKDNIYRVYGREISDACLNISSSDNGMSLTGYIARPLVARSNRSFENFFVNGHAVNDRILEKAVESAYKPFLMQHRFPFVFLFLSMDPGMVDVNVHPRKSEVKFSLSNAVFGFVESAVSDVLKSVELLNRIELAPDEKQEYKPETEAREPFEMQRTSDKTEGAEDVINRGVFLDHTATKEREDGGFFVETGLDDELIVEEEAKGYDTKAAGDAVEALDDGQLLSPEDNDKHGMPDPDPVYFEGEQLDLATEKMIQPANRPDFNIVGCVFDTYWIITYKDRMIMIDQHAAHEKVMYEKFIREYKARKVVSQYVDPPIVLSFDGRQEAVVETYKEAFISLGFELEKLDGSSYALRAIPSGFMKLEQRDIFLGLIDELSEITTDTADVSVIHDRLAQMSCKAAVKGGNRLSLSEAKSLLTDLLLLDNPYNCPHGRPTMVEFTERDLEKFFKRIV